MDSMSNFDYGMWPIVLLNVGFILAFAISFLAPRRRVEWRSLGVFAAWLVALFTEMYGFPLTIYLLTGLLGRSYPALNPFSHVNGHLLVALLAPGSEEAVLVIDIVTTLVFLAGFVLMSNAWQQIHKARGELVTDGLYARVRHPQYVGLFLIIGALLVQWPALLSWLMAPVLFVTYVRLARREERELEAQFGEAYRAYKARVPAFFPRLGDQTRQPGSQSQDVTAT